MVKIWNALVDLPCFFAVTNIFSRLLITGLALPYICWIAESVHANVPDFFVMMSLQLANTFETCEPPRSRYAWPRFARALLAERRGQNAAVRSGVASEFHA